MKYISVTFKMSFYGFILVVLNEKTHQQFYFSLFWLINFSGKASCLCFTLNIHLTYILFRTTRYFCIWLQTKKGKRKMGLPWRFLSIFQREFFQLTWKPMLNCESNCWVFKTKLSQKSSQIFKEIFSAVNLINPIFSPKIFTKFHSKC